MANLLQKALTTVRNAVSNRAAIRGNARGTMSGFAVGVSPLWGQPYPEVAAQDAAGLISRERMREVVMRTPTAAACMNAILDFSGSVKIAVRSVDPTQKVPSYKLKKVQALMRRPNSDQTWRQFLMTLIRDLVTFGYAAVEIVNNPKSLERPYSLWVMDGARLRIDFNEHGYTRGYDMLDAHGIPIIGKLKRGSQTALENIYQFPQGTTMGAASMPSIPSYTDSSIDANPAPGTQLHGWEPNEVIFFSLNPISESVYPHSRIVQLFSSAILEDLVLQFISERFTDSNIPFGVMDLGDITEQELRTAIDNWNAQSKSGNRILMTGSKGQNGSKWMPFGYHLKDLEAVHLLQELRMKIMGILGVTMQELGESQDINKSNGYNLSFTFKKRAIEPLLTEVCETLTRRLLWDTMMYDELEFYFEEIDARDDFLVSQIDGNYQKLGTYSPNELRNKRGLPNIPGGDDHYISTGAAWIPVDLLRKLAEQAIATEQASASVATTGPDSVDTMRFHANAPGVSQVGRPQANAPPMQGHEIGKNGSNGHSRGQSSEMARQLTGQK